MPVNTLSKNRKTLLVRQFSLQNQTSSITSIKARDKLKKQFSEDDGRCLDSVEITGQGWNKGKTTLTSGLNGKSNVGGGKKLNGCNVKPKPAKVAWIDKKQDDVVDDDDNNDYYPKGVEIIATKCQGQPRPLSNKIQRFKNPLIKGNKDSLVYSRLELAERLRNAWSERDKTKPNLNIFLAQGSEQPEQQQQQQPDNVSTLSDTTITKQRSLLQMRFYSNDDVLSTKSLPGSGEKKDVNDVAEENASIIITEVNDDEKSTFASSLRELNKIEIRVNTMDSNKENDNGNVKTTQQTQQTQQPRQQTTATTATALTAKDRRGNFRNGGILNKTITESFSLEMEGKIKSDDVNDYDDNDDDNVKKKKEPKKILVRALSAPNHDQKPIATIQKTVKFMPQKHYDPTEVSPDEIIAIRERIKSAPIRRKLKSAAARRKNKSKPELLTSSDDDDENDENDDGKESKNGEMKKKKTKRDKKNKNDNNVITMVSLVSPAESDTDDSVIATLPMESSTFTTQEEVEKKETTTGDIKTGNDCLNVTNENASSSSFIVQKLITLRKTNKSVSFQHQTNLTKNYLTSFPSRRVPAGTPIIIPSPVINNPALTPAQLKDRDKRLSSIYFTGTDNRGTKRRLIRSPTSETVKDDNIYDNDKTTKTTTTPTTTCSFDINNNNNYIKKTSHNNNNNDKETDFYRDDDDKNKVNEPEFKNPKEKECWILYKKMIENGVTVTFDTVLRGMMTPTEYRLRKNPLKR
ncbi:conserved hypothetical protein [Pediculus humanus corporis]|uniref:Uncharacterized protein n=1 Tax=Pediculus humanus subsp. corporis TaxID=121224 RepID=E0VT30_PEDHC|nr:uncharacterized protein Phum_PHUM426110 [Pediculus humanus corporis]EEB16536.1 conserved hypothetical protein [Pediculus humanus corporis]